MRGGRRWHKRQTLPDRDARHRNTEKTHKKNTQWPSSDLDAVAVRCLELAAELFVVFSQHAGTADDSGRLHPDGFFTSAQQNVNMDLFGFPFDCGWTIIVIFSLIASRSSVWNFHFLSKSSITTTMIRQKKTLINSIRWCMNGAVVKPLLKFQDCWCSVRKWNVLPWLLSSARLWASSFNLISSTQRTWADRWPTSKTASPLLSAPPLTPLVTILINQGFDNYYD